MAGSQQPCRHFCVIGHRGNCQLAPENTLPSFELALQCGPAFETDVQLTSDGTVIVLHCETLERTTSGTGRVDQASWEHVSKLDAGAWFGAEYAGYRVPSLAQLLSTFRGRAHIHLELKSAQEGLAGAVAEQLKASGWLADLEKAAAGAVLAVGPQGTLLSPAQRLSCVPGLTITSFHLEQLQRSMQLLPSVPHAWLIQEITQPTLEVARAAGLQQLCPRVNACTAELVQMALDEGFTTLRGWGVKSEELLKHAIECGLHGATVDWPHRAQPVLDECGVLRC